MLLVFALWPVGPSLVLLLALSFAFAFRAKEGDEHDFHIKPVGQPDKSFTVKARWTDTVSVLAGIVRKHMANTTTSSNPDTKFTSSNPDTKFILVVNGKTIFPTEAWRQVSEYDTMLKTNGMVINMATGLAGGGPKRGRSTGPEKDQIPVVYVPPTPADNDITVVRVALKVSAVSIPDWLDKMTTERLYSLHEAYDAALKASGHIDRHINLMMEYVNEYKALEATQRFVSI